MISSELNEVIGLSDRIYVMYEGEVMGEFSHENATQEAIVAQSVGGVKTKKHGQAEEQ